MWFDELFLVVFDVNDLMVDLLAFWQFDADPSVELQYGQYGSNVVSC